MSHAVFAQKMAMLSLFLRQTMQYERERMNQQYKEKRKEGRKKRKRGAEKKVNRGEQSNSTEIWWLLAVIPTEISEGRKKQNTKDKTTKK